MQSEINIPGALIATFDQGKVSFETHTQYGQGEMDAAAAQRFAHWLLAVNGQSSKLQQLLNLCKCGVFVTVNEHRDYYLTAEQQIEELRQQRNLDDEDLPPDRVPEMIARNTIVEVQFYPDTPVGSYCIYHYDLEAALDEALATAQDNRRRNR